MVENDRLTELSQNDLIAHLKEQLGFLGRSAAMYDAGHYSEAKRIAVHASIIARDSGKQKKNLSLVSILGQKQSIRMLSTADVTFPGMINYVPEMKLCGFRMHRDARLSGYYPYLDNPMNYGTWLTIDEWWDEPVLVAYERFSYTRRELVKWFRNQEGGAHAAPLIPKDLYELTRSNVVGISFGSGELQSVSPSHGPEFATIRQIAWEIEFSLNQFYNFGPVPWEGGFADNHVQQIMLEQPDSLGTMCTFSLKTIRGDIIPFSVYTDGLEAILNQLELLARAAQTCQRKSGTECEHPSDEIGNFVTSMNRFDVELNEPGSQAPATLYISRWGRPRIEIPVSQNLFELFEKMKHESEAEHTDE